MSCVIFNNSLTKNCLHNYCNGNSYLPIIAIQELAEHVQGEKCSRASVEAL